MHILNCFTGDLAKVSELISGLAPGPEEESPYEALFEATSCHSLDSLTSGKSSDRDSGRPDSDAGKVRPVVPNHRCYLIRSSENVHDSSQS